MKPGHIIHLAAVACALFLWEGCARIAVPEPDGSNVIGFNAGTMLLNDDCATKTGSFKEGEFAMGDKIAVFGRRYGNSQSTDVFNGTVVEKMDATTWEYSPLKAWFWITEGDYYDFIGVYPSDKGTSRMDVSGNLAIETHYSINTSNYDLMYALYRRHGSDNDRISAVPLNFQHALCAVRIIFDNDSNDQDITVNSYSFTNMIISADVKATMDVIGNPEITWINTERNGSAVRGVLPHALLTGKNKSGDHHYSGTFDFLIPTALDATSNGITGDEAHMPQLVVNFTPTGQSAIETRVLLKSIQRDPLNGNTTPVDVWEPGIRYTYHVSIRLDGGVLISVITTEWDNVYAETPGVMID